MEIIVLPRDLQPDTSEKLRLFDYRTAQNIQKTKIDLSMHTISFLRMGFKEVIGNSQAVQIDNQQFLIMKSGNCLMTEKTSNSGNIYHSLLLFFDDETALEFLEKYQLFSTSRMPEKSFHIFDYDDFIQQYINSLNHLFELAKGPRQQLLKTKFEEIMLYLTHKYGASFLNTIIQKADDRISRLRHVVERNKFNKLSLEELAFLCNMSISTFKRNFFKHYQNTPMKWFNEQRLNHIAALLKTQHKRPIELYEDAGYENFSNFVQAFKKKFGLTPKQYQRQG